MRFLVMLLALAAIVMLPARALADEALARQHFRKGIELYDRKQYAEALTAFEEAYKEKPSASIKQNIGLSLKGLHRPAEAAASFDEALEEGKDTLKADTRSAMERELAELTKTIATLNVTVVTNDRKPVDATVTITPANEPPRTFTPEAQKRPIRLMPGLYVLAAHASGYPDPPQKKLALVSGPPVDVTFVMGGPQGTLTVKATREEASIKVDGGEVGRGTWTGTVTAGPHKVEASAPGWKTTTADVDVPAGGAAEAPIKLLAATEMPPEYYAPTLKEPKQKRGYLALGLAIETVSYRLGPPLDEPPSGTRRTDFAGLSLSGRLGAFLSKTLAAELLVAYGSNSASYKLHPTDKRDTETSVAHLQLTPLLRFITPGKVRFIAGTGFGVHRLMLESNFDRGAVAVTKKGKGWAFSWLLDLGIQAELGPFFLELAGYVDVHGVGPVRDDDDPHDRLLLASPATRGGVRVSLALPF
jgi:hypothetical protein